MLPARTARPVFAAGWMRASIDTNVRYFGARGSFSVLFSGQPGLVGDSAAVGSHRNLFGACGLPCVWLLTSVISSESSVSEGAES